MKRLMMLTAATCLFAWSVAAQENPRLALAEQLLNAMNPKEVTEKSFDMVKKQMPLYFEQAAKMSGQPIPEKVTVYQEKLMKLLSEELSWEKLKPDYVALYADTFTEEELKGLVAFYASPAGQAFARKQPELMQRSMELSQKMMVKLMPRIQELLKEMKEQLGGAGAPPAAQPKDPK